MFSTNLLPPFLNILELFIAISHIRDAFTSVKRDFKKWSTTRRKNPQRRKDAGTPPRRRNVGRRRTYKLTRRGWGTSSPPRREAEESQRERVGEKERGKEGEREKRAPPRLYIDQKLSRSHCACARSCRCPGRDLPASLSLRDAGGGDRDSTPILVALR